MRVVRAMAASLLVVAVASAGLSSGVARAATGEFSGAFAGSASANGIRITVDAPNSVSRNPVDGGGPTAQATLDSNTNSLAFASQPYPGELPVSGPGLVGGVIAGLFPQLGLPTLPPYPFYVEARNPLTPYQEQSGPGQSIQAKSDATSSSGRASSGFDSPAGSGAFARSTASMAATAENVVARAESTIAGFVAGPLRIGSVTSTALMTLSPDGSLRREGTASIVGASIDGVPVEITDQGVTVSGTTTAAPTTESIRAILEQAQVDISIVPREETPNGVIAPSVRVVQKSPDGTVTFTYVLGSSAAQLTGAAAEGVPATVAGLGENGDPTQNAATPAGSSLAALPGLNALPGIAALPNTTTIPSGPAAAAAGGASDTITPVSQASFDAADLFFGLTAAGALGLLLAVMLGLLGIRGTWSPTGEES